MALNTQHFTDRINKIGGKLRNTNKPHEEIIEKAKHELLDIFLSPEQPITTHEEADQAFDTIHVLITKKANNAKRDDMKTKWTDLIGFVEDSKRIYNAEWFQKSNYNNAKAKPGHEKEIEVCKKLYNIYQTINNYSQEENNTVATNTTLRSTVNTIKEDDDIIDIDYEEIPNKPTETQAEKDLKEQLAQAQAELEKQKAIDTLKAQGNLGSDEDKARIKQLEEEQARMQQQLAQIQKTINQTNPSINNPSVSNPYISTPSVSRSSVSTPSVSTPSVSGTISNTQNDLFSALTVDAHLMDKENLIYESERNRIKEQSERKYEAIGRFNIFKKGWMFATDRQNQRNELEDSIDSQSGANNKFIEDGILQNRIEGMIGTYAKQTDMGMENTTVSKDRTAAFHNNTVDQRADDYLAGRITRAEAIAAFNNALRADGRLSSGMGNERMTGTDLMKQIDSEDRKSYLIKTTLFAHIKNTYNNSFPEQLSEADIATIQTHLKAHIKEKGTYLTDAEKNISPDEIRAQLEKMKADKINQNIEKINTDSFRVRVNLFKIIKTADTEELEGVNYNKRLDKGFVSGLSKVASKLGLPGSIALKIATGAIITATGGAPLYALGGVMAVGSLIQYLKTYRDSTREIAKTQEDAINLGLPELEQRIAQLETAQADAGMFSKIGSTFGRNARNRRHKQLKILRAFQEMRNHGDTMMSVETIINNLNRPPHEASPQIMADTLARIDMGHKYQTQFISTIDSHGNALGRQQTAIKRNEMMEALKTRAIQTPLNAIHPDGSITTISVSATSRPEERTTYRNALKTNPHYTDRCNYLSNNYETVEKNIASTRIGLGLRSAGQYALNTAAAAIAFGIGKAGFDYLNQSSIAPGGAETITEIPPKTIGDQSQFKLSQYQDGTSTQPANTDSFSTLQNGDIIDTAKGEVSVDAVAAKVGSFANYEQIAHQVHDQIGGLGLDTTTTKTLQEALSTSQLDTVMKHAADAGADIGNQKLAALRWTNMIEEFANNLHTNNLNEVIVKNIKRDDSVADMAFQASKNGLSHADATHRGFALIAEATSKVTGETIPIPIPETIGDFFPKESFVAGVFPFFNTYANPGNGNNNKPREYKKYTTQSPRWKFWNEKKNPINKSINNPSSTNQNSSNSSLNPIVSNSNSSINTPTISAPTSIDTPETIASRINQISSQITTANKGPITTEAIATTPFYIGEERGDKLIEAISLQTGDFTSIIYVNGPKEKFSTQEYEAKIQELKKYAASNPKIIIVGNLYENKPTIGTIRADMISAVDQSIDHTKNNNPKIIGLDADTYRLDDNYITSMTKKMNEPGVSRVSGKLRWYDETQAQGDEFAFILERMFDSAMTERRQAKKTSDNMNLSGGSYGFRLNDYKKIGGFDRAKTKGEDSSLGKAFNDNGLLGDLFNKKVYVDPRRGQDAVNQGKHFGAQREDDFKPIELFDNKNRSQEYKELTEISAKLLNGSAITANEIDIFERKINSLTRYGVKQGTELNGSTSSMGMSIKRWNTQTKSRYKMISVVNTTNQKLEIKLIPK